MNYFKNVSLVRVGMLAATVAFSVGAQAQSGRSATTIAEPKNTVARPDTDKTLLQQRVESEPVGGADDAGEEAHFQVQPPMVDGPMGGGDAGEGRSGDGGIDPGFRAPPPKVWNLRPADERGGRRTGYLQIGVGYVNSDWKRLYSGFENGSSLFRIGAFRAWEHFDAGLAFDMITGNGGSANNENMWVYTFGAEGLYRLGDGFIQGITGIGLHLGSYRVWGLTEETSRRVVYDKYAQGFLLGVTPQVGVRLRISPHFAVDVVAKYLAYAGNPQYVAGGWSAGINLNLSRWGH